MTAIIAVAGATGNLGGRIVAALRQRGAEVRALVRIGTASEKTAKLEAAGARVVAVDMGDLAALTAALGGVECVVSAVNGVRGVIVDAQGVLLDAAVAAGVPRFIPSDYAADLTKLDEGENRNFDLRREFHRKLDKAPIRSTSVLIGMFMELLVYGVPMLDLKAKRSTYWGDPDQLQDFTTMDNAAAVTAEVALDPNAPAVVRVAGDQKSVRQLSELGAAAVGAPFELIRAGGIDDLAALINRERRAHPEGEEEEFPVWQRLQYTHNMASGRAKLEPVENARFPDIRWTGVSDLLAGMRR